MKYNNLSIGLFGGSFNPAHAGHMHVALIGLNVLRLDRIWWMVSPQNPLKPQQPSYQSRVQTVEALDLPPRMEVSHMEREFGTQYTIDTLKRARQTWPNAKFVFLMGADNFRQLPKWKNWKQIMDLVPIAIVSRPDSTGSSRLRARLGPAARLYADRRVSETHADILKDCAAPAWTFLTTPHNALSSTAIRRRRANT